ncbi:MAG: Rrf2 family transcriptional regulator [Gemmatimonadota bacterium]
MKLSRTAEYALRAALHIAENAAERATSVDVLADELDVPRNYLSKILHRLTQAGVLASSRGPKGGFRLARPADQITLGEVVDPVDPIATDRTCLLGRPQCSDTHPCPAHGRWRALAEELRVFFHETTLATLLASEAPPPAR